MKTYYYETNYSHYPGSFYTTNDGIALVKAQNRILIQSQNLPDLELKRVFSCEDDGSFREIWKKEE